MHLLILSDGKKGHENQSLGLAEALLRRESGSLKILEVSSGKIEVTSPPAAIIAAGHGTHLLLLKLARRYRCPSIVIMKPTLPTFLFGCCIVPEHDMKLGARPRKNVIMTKGALNRISEEVSPKEKKGLIMLGGACKHFHWETPPVLKAIEAIVSAQTSLQWTVGDSRRTPDGVLQQLAQSGLPLTIAPHQESGGTWLVDQLGTSEVAWITPDSSSMLFEALTAGARLGTLPLNPCHTRISRAHDLLAGDGWLTPFGQYDSALPLPEPPGRIHETARCADLLLPLLKR